MATTQAEKKVVARKVAVKAVAVKAARPARAKPRQPVAPAAAHEAKAPKAPKESTGQGLLRAGLKALGDVRDGVVQRQTRVVESLLGAASRSAAATSSPAKSALDSLGDSLGFRKLEDVFDQRIAAALERLGVPTAQQFEMLQRQLDALTAQAMPSAALGEVPAAATVGARRKR